LARIRRAKCTSGGEGSRCSRLRRVNVGRVKQLREEPYTQKEAEAGMGFTTDNGKRTKTLMEVDGGASA